MTFVISEVVNQISQVAASSSTAAVGSWPWVLEKVFAPVAPTLVLAAVGSWLITRANHRYTSEREHLAKTAAELRERLDDLRGVAGEYWSSNYSAKGSPLQEAEIEFLLQDIGGLVEVCAPRLWRMQGSDGARLVAQLAAQVAPASFATTNRKADPGRVRTVAQAAANISYLVSTELGQFHRRSWLSRIRKRSS